MSAFAPGRMTAEKPGHLRRYKLRVDQMQQILKSGDKTREEVQALIHLSPMRTRDILRELRRDKMIHVCDYLPDDTGRCVLIQYRWGKGIDKRRPGRRGYVEKRPEKAKRIALPIEQAMQASMARILAGLGRQVETGSRKGSPNT